MASIHRRSTHGPTTLLSVATGFSSWNSDSGHCASVMVSIFEPICMELAFTFARVHLLRLYLLCVGRLTMRLYSDCTSFRIV